MVSPALDPAASVLAPQALLARIEALEARVAALEAPTVAIEQAPAALPGIAAGPVPAASPEALSVGAVLSLMGRTCLILGGGFLIRAVTEAGTMPAVLGASLGLAYATVWAFLGHRSGGRGQGPWAAFQVFAAAIIAFPLLYETTVWLKVLPPGGSALVLGAATLALLAIAIRHDLRRVGWITLAIALATGLAIMAKTSAVTRLCPYFIVLSGAGLLVSRREGWRNLRWLAALAADLAVFAMLAMTLSPGGSEELVKDLQRQPGRVLMLALGFAAIQVGGFLYRILTQPKVVGAFEVFQTGAVLALGLGGGFWVAREAGLALGLAGGLTLLAGLACYVCAFRSAGRQTEASLDFKYLTSLAIVLLLAGGLQVLEPQVLSLICLAAGLATTYLGVRHDRLSLQFHGAIYLLAAGLASGLLRRAASAWLEPMAGGGFPAAAWLALAGLAAAHLVPLNRRGSLDGRVQRLPSLGFGALALFGLAGMLTAAAAARVHDAGLLAALRTAILVALAMGVAALGRRQAASELPWLAYPLLGCAALQIILEDLPNGRPPTMFLAFTLFGAGLLLVPRLLGGRAKS